MRYSSSEVGRLRGGCGSGRRSSGSWLAADGGRRHGCRSAAAGLEEAGRRPWSCCCCSRDGGGEGDRAQRALLLRALDGRGLESRGGLGLQESEEDLLFWIMRARQSAPARQGEGIEGRLGLVGRWTGQIPRKKVGRWRRAGMGHCS